MSIGSSRTGRSISRSSSNCSPTNRSIAQSKASQSDKQRQAAALQKKYAGITQELTTRIRDAATKVAQDEHLTLVVTKEGVGYGGVDITKDVEKAMNITEKASPAPG